MQKNSFKYTSALVNTTKKLFTALQAKTANSNFDNFHLISAYNNITKLTSSTAFFIIATLAIIYSTIAFAQDTTLQTQRYIAPTHFNTLTISGPVNVTIDGNAKTQANIELKGDANSIKYVQMKIDNGILFLAMQPEFIVQPNSTLTININSPHINQINYNGTGKISGTNLQGSLSLISTGSGTIYLSGNNLDLRYLNASGSSSISVDGIQSHLLDIKDSSSSAVTLAGSAVLRSIDYRGTGPLKVWWVNSSDVKIHGSGKGLIYLAGIANLLDATINNNTLLNTKYLRADRAFINTAGNSRAQVWTKNNLNAFATGKSIIQYYNDPQFFTGYMTPPALVLRMTGIEK